MDRRRLLEGWTGTVEMYFVKVCGLGAARMSPEYRSSLCSAGCVPEWLSEDVVYTRRLRHANSTRSTYRNGYMSYVRFMQRYFPRRPLLPATDQMISLWFEFQKASCCANTLRLYYYCVGSAHADHLLPFPPLKQSMMAYQTWQGIRREKGDIIKRAHAIRVPDLWRLAAIVKSRATRLSAREVDNDQAVWAGILLGFSGLLRKSTICGPQGLRRHDLEFVRRDGVTTLWVTVRHSKTIQFRQKVHRFPVPAVKSELCAVSAVLRHLLAAPAAPEQAVFMWRPARGAAVPMSHNVFVARMRLLLSEAGLEPDIYTGHSLRRGGATLAFELGDGAAWDRRVKEHGDWGSDVVFQYHEISDDTRMQLPSRMAAAMARPGGLLLRVG